MKKLKRTFAAVLAAIMTLGTVTSAYASTAIVKYKEFVYTDEITFYGYDYEDSIVPSVTYLTVLADSKLGSGSAIYHVKYLDGKIAYCLQPTKRADDSSNYIEGSVTAWYNIPITIQQAIALTMSCGYPNVDYGSAPGDSNSAAIINAEKYAATQAIIWEYICNYRSTANYNLYDNSPFYRCVDTSRYPTFALWYDSIINTMKQTEVIPSFAKFTQSNALKYPLEWDEASQRYTVQLTDTNGVLPNFDFKSLSGNGITFTQSGNKLTVSVTDAAAEKLDVQPQYFGAIGSAYFIKGDEAVLAFRDKTGTYQSVATYVPGHTDPLKAYIGLRVNIDGDVLVIKRDSVTGKPLEGVGFEICDEDGFLMDEGETDENGEVYFPVLPLGVYYVRETKALPGYILDSTKHYVTIKKHDVATVVLTNTPEKKYGIELTKVNAQGAPLQNVNVLLETSTDGGASWNIVGQKASDANGKVKFEDLTPTNLYRLTELSTNAGYSLMSSVIYEGTLPADHDLKLTAVNNSINALPFTGGYGNAITVSLTVLALSAGFILLKKKENKGDKD